MRNQIDLWLISFEHCLALSKSHSGSNFGLESALNLYQSCFDVLSSEEQTRAGKFHFEQDQLAYVFYHGLQRKILASYIENTYPGELVFSIGEHGKPFLENYLGNLKLSFNLSHTKQYAMLAVTSYLDDQCQLGVDIEQNTRVRDYIALAKRFFHPKETEQLLLAPEDQQQALFFKFWTAKEAFVKAIGRGVSFGLENFCVDLTGTNASAGKITHIKNTCKNNELNKYKIWQINYLNAPKDHTACLAYPGKPKFVYYRDCFEEIAF